MENATDTFRSAGYRIIEFSPEAREALRAVATRLIPHESEILSRWIDQQWKTWEPPGISRDEITQVFGDLFRRLLGRMERGELEQSVADLAEAGLQLAERQFPFQALIISIHFLEESYIPYLISPRSDSTQEWLITVDEFLHQALAAIASSYFEAYRAELLDRAEVGRVVQESLMADIPKRIADLEIGYAYISATERAQLGGDFLDFFPLDDASAAFIVGDFSGHGLEALADSVMLRSLFRGFIRERADLAAAMSRLNRVLAAELRPNQFATALAGMYRSHGRLSVVSAGHPAPVLCSETCAPLETTGMALAADEESVYPLTEIELHPGTSLVVYTDGLLETRRDGSQLGEEDIAAAVCAVRGAPARTIVEHLLDESRRHAGGSFHDDVVVLAVNRLKGGASEDSSIPAS